MLITCQMGEHPYPGIATYTSSDGSVDGRDRGWEGDPFAVWHGSWTGVWPLRYLAWTTRGVCGLRDYCETPGSDDESAAPKNDFRQPSEWR